MVNITYNVARAVENFSVAVGWGPFDLSSDSWKCAQCLERNDTEPCTTCKKQYMHELSQTSYSNRFERRLTAITGSACIWLGFSVWGANLRFGWWDMGTAFSVMTELLRTNTPGFIGFIYYLLSPIPPFLVLAPLLVSLSIVLLGLAIMLFLYISNPMAERHWRHMTRGMWCVLGVQGVLEVVFLSWGMRVQDAAFVFGPLAVGGSALAGSVVMDVRRGEEEGLEGGNARKIEEGRLGDVENRESKVEREM